MCGCRGAAAPSMNREERAAFREQQRQQLAAQAPLLVSGRSPDPLPATLNASDRQPHR